MISYQRRFIYSLMDKEGVVLAGLSPVSGALIRWFSSNGIETKCIFESDSRYHGKRLDGIPIVPPDPAFISDNFAYVIDSPKGLRYMYRQRLLKLGVAEEAIQVFHTTRDYEYMSTLDSMYYKDELSDIYRVTFGRELDWANPKRYTEKVNWEKINLTDPRRTNLADKYLVRSWIREQIGEEYLTKLYGVWEDAEDIDFDALPEKFVLKLNSGSGRNIVVNDRSKTDLSDEKVREEIKWKLTRWKTQNYGYHNFELWYRDIKPVILCEEYLEGVADTEYDYQFFCFHGEPRYVWCVRGSHKPDCRASFYTPDWVMQPFSFGYPRDEKPAPRPARLDDMLSISQKLSRPFRHVRVDLYNLRDGRIVFGEMTFGTWGGLMHFVPEEYDEMFGKMI